MKNYGVFYSFTEEKEYLLILFSDDEITYQKSFEHVIVSYHDVDVVSYKIKGINKIMKIHADGLIPVLSKELLKLINSILLKDGLAPLEEKVHSGFYNGEVVDKNPIKVKTRDGIFILEDDYDVQIGDRVVLTRPDTFLFDKTYLRKHHLCSYKDLEISDDDKVFVDNELDINGDFFLTKEN